MKAASAGSITEQDFGNDFSRVSASRFRRRRHPAGTGGGFGYRDGTVKRKTADEAILLRTLFLFISPAFRVFGRNSIGKNLLYLDDLPDSTL